MFTYLGLIVVLIIISCLIILLFHLKMPKVKILLLLAVTLFLITLLFDSYLTWLPIVRYNIASTLHIQLGSIPIEDFGYVICVVLLVPAIFNAFHDEKNHKE